jgi:hypothetical protein
MEQESGLRAQRNASLMLGVEKGSVGAHGSGRLKT